MVDCIECRRWVNSDADCLMWRFPFDIAAESRIVTADNMHFHIVHAEIDKVTERVEALYIYYRFIVRFPIGLDFLFITFLLVFIIGISLHPILE